MFFSPAQGLANIEVSSPDDSVYTMSCTVHLSSNFYSFSERLCDEKVLEKTKVI